MSEQQPLSQLAVAVIDFLGRFDRRVYEDREADLIIDAVDNLIKNIGLTDGFSEVATAYRSFRSKPQYCGVPDASGVLEHLAIQEAEIVKWNKIEVLVKRVGHVNFGLGVSAAALVLDGFQVFYMFQLFGMTPAELVRHFGVEDTALIVAYFARVGLIHGEPLDPELKVELQRLGLWRDSVSSDSGSPAKT